jgi:signal transduction histidine kinase
MERIVRDFGDLSEIEADSVELRLGVHDAGEMLEIAASAERGAASARGITLEVTRPAEPLPVRWDRDRILRALAHVIDNAIRFAPDGSTVSLAVSSAKNDQICFRVTDHGLGLSAETKEHLYDRQWLAKRAERVGAGLGLAIVRGFLTAHDGQVDLDSHDGETTATLLLPREPVLSTTRSVESEPERDPAGQPSRPLSGSGSVSGIVPAGSRARGDARNDRGP